MLSSYEERVLVEIEERKQRELAKSPRRLVPQRVKDATTNVTGRARTLPGAEQAAQAAAAGYEKAAVGLGKFMTRSSQFTLNSERVLKAYRRRGNTLGSLEDIHTLDLKVVDSVAKFTRLNQVYASAAMAEGVGAAALIGGGAAIAGAGGIAGAGAGAAPGLGLVAVAVASDATLVLGAASRAVAHTALYFGYDPTDPREEVFMMSVMGLGAATTQGAKMAAYSELSRLTQLLVRNAPWEQLNQFALTAIATRFAEQFGARLTKKKLGQFVPVAGMAIGGGLNYRTVDRIADAAYWTYRERFLRQKLGEAMTIPDIPLAESEGEVGVLEDPIDILKALEEQGIEIPED